jgi:Raf kinase inhibitor-like YbhB/YbcL family protein
MKRTTWVLGLIVLVAGCNGSPSNPSGAPSALVLTSSAFVAGGMIPAQYRCTGLNISPPLAWTGGPQAQGYVLLVEDPDAPGGVFLHWVLYGLPGATRSLAENASPGGPLPAGTQSGTNDFQVSRYVGPCAPQGEVHRYVFRLFALSGALQLADGASATAVRQAMQGRILAETELTGNTPR